MNLKQKKTVSKAKKALKQSSYKAIRKKVWDWFSKYIRLKYADTNGYVK